MNRNFQTPILIIGNGGAAASAVKAMREAGYQGPMDLVADDAAPPFNPMLLPYFLKGAIDRQACHPFGLDFYDEHQVNAHLGHKVTALNAADKTAVLADGTVVAYDKCLIASGAGSVSPPVPGLDQAKRALSFRTRLCGDRIGQAVQNAGSAVVLGASLVGAKLAEVLAGLGLEVFLIDIADRLLPGISHLEASKVFEKLFAELGVKVLLQKRLSEISETDDAIMLHFDDGEVMSADLACVCTGVRPRLEFLDPKQVSIRTGAVVDKRCHCNAPGLYAAGDAAEGLNLLTGRFQWFGLWGKACYQGRTAAYNMVGLESFYPGTMPEYITPLLGRVFAGFGDVNGKGEKFRTFIYQGQDGGAETILSFEDGMLVGANLMGDLHGLGLLKTAALKRLDLGKMCERIGGPRLEELLESIAQHTRMDTRTTIGRPSIVN